MSRRRRAAGPAGLTLIELVLTLSILALAGVVVSGSFTTGMRAWESGRERGRRELVARIVLERISAQLRSAVSSPARLTNEDAVAFFASADALRFVTLSGAGSAPVQVSYAIGSEDGAQRLIYREYPWPDKEFFTPGRPRREEAVGEVVGLAVEVTRRPEEGETEEPVPGEWNPHDQVLPGSVGVAIEIAGDDGAPPRRYRVVVPLPSQGSQ